MVELEGVVGILEFVASWSEARVAWNPQIAAGIWSEGSWGGLWSLHPGSWCQTHTACPRRITPSRYSAHCGLVSGQASSPGSQHCAAGAWPELEDGSRWLRGNSVSPCATASCFQTGVLDFITEQLTHC